MTLPLNTSYKQQAIIGLLLGIWLVLFLILIAPFDAADLSIKVRFLIMPVYGVICFFGYLMLIPLQNWVFQKSKRWTLWYEIIFIAFFNIVALFGCFLYYKTDIVNGTYSFFGFTFEIYFPIFFIILTTLIFLRWFVFKPKPSLVKKKVTLTGENKRDVLVIPLSDLVSISSADNYVEVSYLKNKTLTKKLLRNTLKSMQQEVDILIKVHRSHLINPEHFIEWKDANTIVLTQTELPVSKTYKSAIESIPKT